MANCINILRRLIYLSGFDPMDSINRMTREHQRKIDESMRSLQEVNRKKEERAIADSAALQQIASNTKPLSDMLSLIQHSNDKQDEIFELLVEMLAISKSTNKKEAEGAFKTVMNKAIKLGSDYDSITKLGAIGTLLINILFPPGTAS